MAPVLPGVGGDVGMTPNVHLCQPLAEAIPRHRHVDLVPIVALSLSAAGIAGAGHTPMLAPSRDVHRIIRRSREMVAREAAWPQGAPIPLLAENIPVPIWRRIAESDSDQRTKLLTL